MNGADTLQSHFQTKGQILHLLQPCKVNLVMLADHGVRLGKKGKKLTSLHEHHLLPH